MAPLIQTVTAWNILSWNINDKLEATVIWTDRVSSNASNAERGEWKTLDWSKGENLLFAKEYNLLIHHAVTMKIFFVTSPSSKTESSVQTDKKIKAGYTYRKKDTAHFPRKDRLLLQRRFKPEKFLFYSFRSPLRMLVMGSCTKNTVI